MAWIKLETHTFDKVEIYTISEDLGIDADSVIGKCCRVWAWFDANTTDGVTRSVTKALLDRQCGVTGFCNAMIKAGWMDDDGEELKLPFYDRHNSATAKSRALGSKRQHKFKNKDESNGEGNAKGNASDNGYSLHKSSRREEKRREEESREEKDKGNARGSRLPTDWQPSEQEIEFCQTERPDLDCQSVADQFRDYWHGVAGAKGCKLDWSATWRNWVRSQKKSFSSKPQQGFVNGLGEHGQKTAAAAQQFLESFDR